MDSLDDRGDNPRVGVFEELIHETPKPRWRGNVETLRAHRRAGVTLSKSQVRLLVETAAHCLTSGKAHVGGDMLFAGLILEEHGVRSEIQRAGVFRVSRRRFIVGARSVAVAFILVGRSHLDPTTVDYLESIANLHTIARAVHVEYREIAKWLREDREVGLKGALANLDWDFLHRTYAAADSDTDWPEQSDPQYGPEQLAEGVSTLFAIYVEHFGIPRGNAGINAEAVARGDYLKRLRAAARLVQFRDWELLVDRMGYRIVTGETPCVFRVVPGSAELHRAAELGHIQAHAQRVFRPARELRSSARSFLDLGRMFTEGERGDFLVKRVEKPVPRFRLEFPEPLLEMLGQVGELTREEQFALAVAVQDLVATPEEIHAFRLAGSLTVRDLSLGWRILQMLRCVHAEVLRRQPEKDLPLVLQSLVPTFDKATLVRMFGFVMSAESAEAAFELLRTDYTKHIDVQYQPILPVGKVFVMPLNVIASSNLYRNPLVVSRRRLHEDGRTDPVSNTLLRVFESKGRPCRSGVHYAWNGEAGECDVLAVVDDLVLVLECKNSLLPTSSHEMLTSLDYIRTAAAQLNRFSRCFANSEFRSRLSRSAGIVLPDRPRLVTGIIMANRMFIGWRQDGHAVRGMYELQRFVEDGTVDMGGETRLFWQGPTLAGEDVRRFFEEDITYVYQWRSMEPMQLVYEFPGCTVETEKLAINPLTLARELGFGKTEQEILRLIRERAADASVLPTTKSST